MDITYTPYIRESTFNDLSIKTPTIDITGYRPKYTVNKVEEDTVTPVESQIEEIKKPTSIVKKTFSTSKFGSKKKFKDVMTPIYEDILFKRGLNPIFAKALVAQDGLESAWGAKPSGSFNFGGIKGKGTVKRTREVINGKDVYINDSFRDFGSLADYADFKINLLSNNRYNAFSGDISGFAERVHKGGYATDPNYTKVLNKLIASAKHGGVIRFQQGGLVEGREWVKNWYHSRRPLIKKNIQTNQKIPVPVTGALGYNILAHNIDLTTASIDPSKVPSGADGVYSPRERTIRLRDDSPTVAVHEWTHSSRPDPQIREIDKIKNILGDSLYDQKLTAKDDYLDDPQEIYSRLMQLRHALNADPNHKFTNAEIDALKKEHTKREILFSTMENGVDTNRTMTTFNKDGKVIQTESYVEGSKPVPEKSNYFREYDVENTFNILNRYSTDGIRRLLNDVAELPKERGTTIYAQLGVKIPKYQSPAGVLMRPDVKQWMYDKNGEYSWARRNKRTSPEFWNRLTNNKRSVPNWENLEEVSTHKLGYAGVDDRTIIYPEVQEINGKLIDFTRPPYSRDAGIESALDTKNYSEIPSAEMAENFTKTYKQAFSGFKDYDIFPEADRDTFHLRSDKADYLYNKLLSSGYNPIQASAVIGSAYVEGQLNENRHEKGSGRGYGLMQWTHPSRVKNLQKFVSPTAKNEFERQVDFIIHELKDTTAWNGGKAARKAFLEEKDVDKASELLTLGYLNPRRGSEHFDRRKRVAGYYATRPSEYKQFDIFNIKK